MQHTRNGLKSLSSHPDPLYPILLLTIMLTRLGLSHAKRG